MINFNIRHRCITKFALLQNTVKVLLQTAEAVKNETQHAIYPIYSLPTAEPEADTSRGTTTSIFSADGNFQSGTSAPVVAIAYTIADVAMQTGTGINTNTEDEKEEESNPNYNSPQVFKNIANIIMLK